MNKRGSILIEGLLAVVVLTMVVLAVVPMLSFLLRRTSTTRSEGEAALLLQEVVESTYNIFTSNWTSYPDGTYYPAKSANNRWALVNGEQSNLQNMYTRSVSIKKACRDQNGEIIETAGACGGITDQNSKVMSATIKWTERDEQKELTAQYLLINLQKTQQ